MIVRLFIYICFPWCSTRAVRGGGRRLCVARRLAGPLSRRVPARHGPVRHHHLILWIPHLLLLITSFFSVSLATPHGKHERWLGRHHRRSIFGPSDTNCTLASPVLLKLMDISYWPKTSFNVDIHTCKKKSQHIFATLFN
jgi:hypothetical protein